MNKRNTANGARIHSYLDAARRSIRVADCQPGNEWQKCRHSGLLSTSSIGVALFSLVRDPRQLQFNYKSVTSHF